MKILFVVTFTIVFIFITWLLVYLSGNNAFKLFLWTRNVYIIILPISFLILLCESYITKKWPNLKGLAIGIFALDFLFVIVLLTIWLIYRKRRDKANYYNKRDRYLQIYMDQRLYILFMIGLIVVPVLNIYNLISFVKTYCIS